MSMFNYIPDPSYIDKYFEREFWDELQMDFYTDAMDLSECMDDEYQRLNEYYERHLAL